jgi:hypothetical protein
MNGKLAAALDLRTMADRRHLYGIGPIEQLRGDVTIADSRPALARVASDGTVKVTQSFETGVPFFVWAEVPLWRQTPIPSEVRRCTVGRASIGAPAIMPAGVLGDRAAVIYAASEEINKMIEGESRAEPSSLEDVGRAYGSRPLTAAKRIFRSARWVSTATLSSQGFAILRCATSSSCRFANV